jgi:hypothetical protein
VSEAPAAEQPLSERPLSEQPLSEQPLSEQPLSEQPLSEQPLREQPEPSLRPYDPAGTQPKVDPRSLESPPQLQAAQATFLPAPIASPPIASPPIASPPIASPPIAPPPIAPPPIAPPPIAPSPDPEPMALDRPREPSSAQQSHAPRFQFLLGALGALGVCAVGLVVLLLSAPKAAPPKPWSAWHPATSGIDPAEQIAAHVAPEYRLDNGKQIVQVTGGPPELKGQPMTIGETRSGQQPTRLEGNSVLYRMCGRGSGCSIKEGKPSLQRGLLLSREALELALYTFRYVDGVSQVIVTIPPASGTPAKHALMFRSQDVATVLGQPLSKTLAAATPRVSQMDRSTDAPLVKELTDTRLYDYWVDEVPQSGAVMLLEPPSS